MIFVRTIELEISSVLVVWASEAELSVWLTGGLTGNSLRNYSGVLSPILLMITMTRSRQKQETELQIAGEIVLLAIMCVSYIYMVI